MSPFYVMEIFVLEKQVDNKMNATGKGGFQPGESGNPRGRPKGQGLTDELSLLIDKKKLAEKIIWLGMEKNDIRALMYIYDRIDGKPVAFVVAETSENDPWLAFAKEIHAEAEAVTETAVDPSTIREGEAEDTDPGGSGS